MYSEDDLLPISALQHLAFCERQWGLIHIEQHWEENRFTAEGRLLHDRVHDAASESRPGVLISRGLHVHSFRFGLTGQADVVEFHPLGGPEGAACIPDREGWWRPFPIEYKRGLPKADCCDEVQLCAQVLCLEEMFGVTIPRGALFYGKVRRRTDVDFAQGLRERVEQLSARMHELHSAGVTPAAEYSRKCEKCSLYDRCLPRTAARRKPVGRYLASALRSQETGS